jgi:hypothetical protein
VEDFQGGGGAEQRAGHGFGGRSVMAGEDSERAEIFWPAQQLPAQRRLHFGVLFLQPMRDETLHPFNVLRYTDMPGQLVNGDGAD